MHCIVNSMHGISQMLMFPPKTFFHLHCVPLGNWEADKKLRLNMQATPTTNITKHQQKRKPHCRDIKYYLDSTDTNLVPKNEYLFICPNNIKIGADWFWKMLIYAFWCWLLIGPVWLWLINSDWCWLNLIDSDWFLLMLIDSDWCRLILIDGNWFWW